MFYILDSSGFIEEVSTHYIERDNKTCAEYTGAIPSGYDSLDDWVLNANIRAYKIDNGNLVYDADRAAALEAEWEKAKFPSDQIYSTNEQVIGAWIDGKPLYRKVVIDENRKEVGLYSIAHGISNIETVTKADAIQYYPDGYWPFPLYYNDYSKVSYLKYINDTTVDIYFGDSWVGITYVILEYTKTTD